jgi:low temperature requirement protein LtrA
LFFDLIFVAAVAQVGTPLATILPPDCFATPFCLC